MCSQLISFCFSFVWTLVIISHTTRTRIRKVGCVPLPPMPLPWSIWLVVAHKPSTLRAEPLAADPRDPSLYLLLAVYKLKRSEIHYCFCLSLSAAASSAVTVVGVLSVSSGTSAVCCRCRFEFVYLLGHQIPIDCRRIDAVGGKGTARMGCGNSKSTGEAERVITRGRDDEPHNASKAGEWHAKVGGGGAGWAGVSHVHVLVAETTGRCNQPKKLVLLAAYSRANISSSVSRSVNRNKLLLPNNIMCISATSCSSYISEEYSCSYSSIPTRKRLQTVNM